MGLLARFEALNQTDLSGLQQRVNSLIAKIEGALATQGKTLQTATAADLSAAATSSGLTADDFINALKTAQKSAT